MEHPSYGTTKRRAFALALVIVLVFGAYSTRLFQIQIVEGNAYAQIANKSTTITVPIAASRGEILDRTMRPMAINRTSFSVVFDYAFFPHGKSDEVNRKANDIILSLTALLASMDGKWNDTLPISKELPYAFAEERENSIAYLKSSAMLRMGDYATAEQCMAELVKRYKLADYTPEQQRTIAGVRYEIDIRQFAIKNPFIFSSDITEDMYNKILENSARYPGVNVQTTPVREYASGTIAAHLMGTVGPIYAEEYAALKDQGYLLNDTVGKSGIESAMESALRGKNGLNSLVKDANGTVIDKVQTTAPVPGNSVILTLDSELQLTAQNELTNTINTLRSQVNVKGKGEDVRSGSVVMIDVKTGGVLVSASWPNYDLSTYNANYSQLIADPEKPLFNRALNGAFAVGSTMKPGVALAGLTEGIITPTSTLASCSGGSVGIYTYYSPSYEPKCMGLHGRLNVSQALSKSCNVFFYDLGRLLGIDKMNRYSTLFGLGQKTGIEVGEATGVLAGPAYRKSIGAVWNPGDTCAAAIGQSDNLFTPIQLAAYAMTIANDGVRYKTHLVKSVRSYDGTETAIEPEVAATVELTQEAIDAVRKGMIEATISGTAQRQFSGASYKVAAKTGTAQVSNDRSDHGVFIGYAPAENPEVAIAVVLEDGTSSPSTYLARTMLDAYFASKKVGVAPTPEGQLLP